MKPRTIEDFQALIASGHIYLGMTRSEVKAVIGEPTDFGCSSRRYQAPRILKYGEIELGFGKRYRDGLELVYRDEDGHGRDFVTLLKPPGTPELPKETP